MSTYNVLSLDGGGVFVVMPLLFLKRIEQARPGFLASVDVFAGTSAGGIAALLIASEEDPVAGLDKAIRFWETTRPVTRGGLHHVQALAGLASFALNDSLARPLRRLLGAIRFGELPKKAVVAAIELDNRNPDPFRRSWQPRGLTNLAVAGGRYDDDLVVDIALRTSASPIMSRVHQGYVDGGIFANDPSMLTLSLLMRQIRHEHQITVHGRDLLDDVSLFSLSEGHRMHYQQGGTEDWGYNHWLFSPKLPFALVELALTSGGEEISEQCRLLLGDNQYFRLNPLIKPPVSRATHVPSLSQVLKHMAADPTAGLQRAKDPGEAALAEARRFGSTYDLSIPLEWLNTSQWFSNVGGLPSFLTRPEAESDAPKRPRRGHAGTGSEASESPGDG